MEKNAILGLVLGKKREKSDEFLVGGGGCKFLDMNWGLTCFEFVI